MKKVEPPDIDAENFGFDLSTHEGRLLWMRYWHQCEHEEDEVTTYEESENVEQETDEQVDITAEFQRQLEEYKNAEKHKLRRSIINSIAIILVTALVAVFLSHHLRWV